MMERSCRQRSLRFQQGDEYWDEWGTRALPDVIQHCHQAQGKASALWLIHIQQHRSAKQLIQSESSAVKYFDARKSHIVSEAYSGAKQGHISSPPRNFSNPIAYRWSHLQVKHNLCPTSSASHKIVLGILSCILNNQAKAYSKSSMDVPTWHLAPEDLRTFLPGRQQQSWRSSAPSSNWHSTGTRLGMRHSRHKFPQRLAWEVLFYCTATVRKTLLQWPLPLHPHPRKGWPACMHQSECCTVDIWTADVEEGGHIINFHKER